ncbi:MAG: glycosyltransferase family 4 protein [Acidobacteria bacterium]|nr:glycosyltransferase family 4 protein [Acidobacteriota bacterium]
MSGLPAMNPVRVLVLEAQVPFVRGGAESLVRELVLAFRAEGCEAEVLSIPFTDSPREEMMAGVAAWRTDVSRFGGTSVDLVVATKFPTYFARHPRKALWLVHQHRAAYELCGTPYSDFAHVEQDVALRRRLVACDARALAECTTRFTIARTVSERLMRSHGVLAEPLYHPPRLADRLRAGPFGDYFLLVSRLEPVKRVHLAIEAMRWAPAGTTLRIAGEGSAAHDLAARIDGLGLRNRVSLLGRVDDDRLVDLYAGARGVVFTPFDEDYGYVTLEAFLSRKPVITTLDAGGPLEFVVPDRNGLVCTATPESIGTAMSRLAADQSLAQDLGASGHAVARAVTWQGVVQQFLRTPMADATGDA